MCNVLCRGIFALLPCCHTSHTGQTVQHKEANWGASSRETPRAGGTDNADWCLRCKTRRSTLCKSSGVLLKFQVKPQAESQATSRATSRRIQPPVNSTRVHHHHPDPFIKSNKKLCIPLPKSQYKCAKLGDYDIKISAT